jgi:hypothetical protein
LERSAHAGAGVAVVIKDFVVLEAPRLENGGVGIIGLDEVILSILLVEEEDLFRERVTLLAHLNQSLS